MNELQKILTEASYAIAPSSILDGLTDELAHRKPEGATHSIYEEVWHMAFWQRITLDWVAGIETAYPASPRDGFPTVQDMERERWDALRERFLKGTERAASAAGDESRQEVQVRCTSPVGRPMRTKTVRGELEELGAHNAYHLGRVVLLRQLMNLWPPKSGGFIW